MILVYNIPEIVLTDRKVTDYRNVLTAIISRYKSDESIIKTQNYLASWLSVSIWTFSHDAIQNTLYLQSEIEKNADR